MNRTHPFRRQQGLSIVDSLIALSVTSVAIGAAVPGFEPAAERRHLQGASAQLETDIQLARSEAVLRKHNIRLAFKGGADDSCYILHTGQINDCACNIEGQPICKPGAKALRSVYFGESSAVKLRSNVSTITFEPNQGTVTPTGTFKFTGKQGREVRLIVNIMGRVRACSPDKAVSGYTNC